MITPEKNKIKNALGSASRSRHGVSGKSIRPGLLPLVVVIFAITLITTLVFVVVHFVRTSPAFALKTIDIQCSDTLQKNQILEVSGLKIGMRLTSIDADSVVKKLQSIHTLSFVHVKISLPNKVVIKLSKRVPIAACVQKGLFGIDKEGVLIPLSVSSMKNVPLVFGYRIFKDSCGVIRIDSVSTLRLNNFLAAVHEYDKNCMQTISQIRLSGAGAITCVFADIRHYAVLNEKNIRPALERFFRIEQILAEASDTLSQCINLYSAQMAYVN